MCIGLYIRTGTPTPLLLQPPRSMAGLAINPVQGFSTLPDFDCEIVRLETGSELPSSWSVVPAYGANRNQNILDFMRWSDFDHGAQDLKES